jgi:hypothetical protein
MTVLSLACGRCAGDPTARVTFASPMGERLRKECACPERMEQSAVYGFPAKPACRPAWTVNFGL